MTNKADQKRFDAFRRIGCVACLHVGRSGVPADVHHLLTNGRRAGHQSTIPLCPHHHRGVTPDGMTYAEVAAQLGPSLAREPKKFREEFGSDETLLALTNALIARLYETHH